MNINVPNLINAALPERDTRNRNAIIISENTGGGSANHNEAGFLSSSFPRSAHKLFVTSDSDDFDEGYLAALRDEGFVVQYFALGEGTSDDAYRRQLAQLKDVAALGPCETFAVVAFGEAASLCLEYWHGRDNNPEYKLAGIVAYYPTRIPDPRGAFPGGIRAVAHLVGEEVGVVHHSQLVGIQGKTKVSKRAVAGVGVAGMARVGGNATNYPCYRYEAPVGFAEADLDEYEVVAADLAWSRSLDTLRTAFRMDVELDDVVEKNMEGKFESRNLGDVMATYTTRKSPHVTYFPTLSGGIGTQELKRFYGEYFISSNPSSIKVTLISRTAGSDRVVDELHVSFKHTEEMPWILPGVPPTNKRVEVAIVSIVTLRGGKLSHEHVYWDQASVLMQVGLLDPKLIPEKAKAKGVKKLPVVGREAARRLLKGFEDDDDNEGGEADNELLPGWYNEEEEDDEDGNNEDSKKQSEEDRAARKPNGKDEGGEDETEQQNRPKDEETQPSGGQTDDGDEDENGGEKDAADEGN
ncbi:hypothetical protein F4808DRAFT_464616 [Astrocystis sublimbata]|nr:hypothetical protein F4808DRAFT_464616 [Astrocystis sublimbata]